MLMCMCLQLPRLVSIQELRAETRRLLRLVQHKTKRPPVEPLDAYPNDKRVSALFKWVHALCQLHGFKIHDFRSSFGDGRALCYLVSLKRCIRW